MKQKYGMDPPKHCEVFRKDMSEEENKKRTLKILKRKEKKAKAVAETPATDAVEEAPKA